MLWSYILKLVILLPLVCGLMIGCVYLWRRLESRMPGGFDLFQPPGDGLVQLDLNDAYGGADRVAKSTMIPSCGGAFCRAKSTMISEEIDLFTF